MDQQLSLQLFGILAALQRDCERAIRPNTCILEETSDGSAYHFVVPNTSRRKVVAWGHLRPGGSKKRGVAEPCVNVNVWAKPLDVSGPPFAAFFDPKANWGSGGAGEVKAAIRELGDSNYQVILKALVQVARSLI